MVLDEQKEELEVNSEKAIVAPPTPLTGWEEMVSST